MTSKKATESVAHDGTVRCTSLSWWCCRAISQHCLVYQSLS